MKRWLCAALMLALIVILAGCGGPDTPAETAAPTAAPTATPTTAPTETPAPADVTAAPADATDEPTEVTEPTPEPAKGYVLVTWSTGSGWIPLAPEGIEYSYPFQQMDSEGHLLENVIHITDSGVYMESATCDNQDCVHQGYVTLENRDERVLYNMIICLPQQVALELYSWQELLEMFP